ncbi:MAG: cellulase family glycosylhydrolase [Melioribacteraceae bacterium]|nr:cellulase family glycosylhydrolase [Melioribacteraceae bacterium]
MNKILLILCLTLFSVISNAQVPLLNVENGRIVDTDGTEILLKGVQFEFGSARGDVPYFNENDTSQSLFLDNMLKHIVIEDDFIDIKNMCANTIRLSLITYRDFENDRLPFTYKENNFQQLDSVVQWAKNHNIYLIISMRQSPGGHNTSPHSGNGGLNELWSNNSFQQRIATLWRKIAERYVNEPIIAGYDLLNEPEAPDSASLNTVYQSIIDSIRSVDTTHILFLEGNLWAQYTNWIDPNLDTNMALSVHYYLPSSYAVNGIGTYPDVGIGFTKNALSATLKGRINHAESLNLPCYVGEFGAMTSAGGYLDYDKDMISIMDSLSLSWNYYNYKNIKGAANTQAFYYANNSNAFVQMIASLQGGTLFSSFSQLYVDSVLASIETPNLFIKQNLMDMLTNAMCLPLSVSDYNRKSNFNIKIYPNPFNTSVTIILNKEVVNAKFYIYDIVGNLIKTGILKNRKEFVIVGNDISSGTYFISVVDNFEIMGQGKIVLLK